MKKIVFTLLLIFPLALFSQEPGLLKLPLIFILSSDELRTLVMSKTSQIKMTGEEIINISKIIDEKKEEYLKLVDEVKKSVPFDANGKPTRKADPEKIREREELRLEVCTSINKILGDKRYDQFYMTLANESARRNAEGLNNAMKNKKK